MKFTVLIEHDFAQSNYAGYVPELRLSAVGDTQEEVVSALQDMIQHELDRGSVLPVHRFEVQSMSVTDVKGGEINHGLESVV
ncbi:Uncharacterised protein [Actinobacillus pleuropneumoniae]|jgi:predicted RNase H-like HicB family nuclease|nr:Uncharacterised protein [Actinobacillus pleuropneumoniae]